MTTETVLPIDREAVISRSKQNNEPEWLSELRLEALQAATRLELPKLEKTAIRRWKLDAYGSYRQEEKLTSLDSLPQQALDLLTASEADTNLLVQRNAEVVYDKLAEDLKAKGVVFTSLSAAVRDHEQLVREYLFKAIGKDEHRLTALHAAYWSGGVFMYVPRNVQVEVPLQGLFIADEEGTTCAPHILIVAEDNSSVTYVDNTVSGPGVKELVHSRAVEVFVKPGAKVTFASVHHLNKGIVDISIRRAVVENDGSIDWIIGEMNDGNGLSDTTSILKGNGSKSNTRAVCIGMGEQQLDLTTRAVHIGKHSDSNMVTRAVMQDQATAIINGITKIEHGATHANGEQTERVLMLSPQARGDANPMLLIDEDEVTAGHAASVGQVDENQIYYMMSRGISREMAERLIIYGFLEPIVKSIPLKEVSEQLQKLVERKLER